MSKWDAFLVICNFRELKSLAKYAKIISSVKFLLKWLLQISHNGVIFLAINATVDCVISVYRLDILPIFFLNAGASCICYCSLPLLMLSLPDLTNCAFLFLKIKSSLIAVHQKCQCCLWTLNLAFLVLVLIKLFMHSSAEEFRRRGGQYSDPSGWHLVTP